jgi:hypothetical protein
MRWTEHVADEHGRRGLDAIESIPRPVGVAGRPVPSAGLVPSPRGIVGLIGSVVAVVAIVAMPWFEDVRIAQLGSLAAAGASWLEASYFESGWIVTVVAVFLAGVAATSRARAAWPAAVPVGIGTVWAVASTIAVKGDLTGFSLGYGFFVALAGLVAATVAPCLPGPPEAAGSR